MDGTCGKVAEQTAVSEDRAEGEEGIAFVSIKERVKAKADRTHKYAKAAPPEVTKL